MISAVGHETDTTLCDYAADRRAPTPTAAAEMAVPVRAELAAQLDELALRKRRCALRPVTLGRERLEARVQRLPKPEALLAAKAQRLDELGERLRRGLARSGGRQARAAWAVRRRKLSLPLLRHRVQSSAARLARAGLTPALLQPPLARGARQPRRRSRACCRNSIRDMPLQRGYALVTDAQGQTLTGRAQAAREAALVLEFRDGELPVTVGSADWRLLRAPPAAPSRAEAERGQRRQTRQGDLF